MEGWLRSETSTVAMLLASVAEWPGISAPIALSPGASHHGHVIAPAPIVTDACIAPMPPPARANSSIAVCSAVVNSCGLVVSPRLSDEACQKKIASYCARFAPVKIAGLPTVVLRQPGVVPAPVPCPLHVR